MAKLRDVIEGLKVMAEVEGEDTHLGGAEHDIIYGSLDSDAKLTPEQKKRLEDAGWHIDSETDSWARFT